MNNLGNSNPVSPTCTVVNAQSLPANTQNNPTTNCSFFAKYENLFKKFTEEISQIFTKTLKNREHPTSAKSVIEFLYQTAYCTLKAVLELTVMLAGDIIVGANIIKNVMSAFDFVKSKYMPQQKMLCLR